MNILSAIVSKLFHISLQEKSNPLLNLSPLQLLLFVLIYASVAEELLFRGFLLNMLEPLIARGFRLFRIKISVPVIISAVLFGLAHFVLLKTGANIASVFSIVLGATVVGLIAGYFQEKYENNTLLGMVVHVTFNAMGAFGLLLMWAMHK